METITLPAPRFPAGGMNVMEALKGRYTSRHFDTHRRLDLQTLSELLWAMYGINRPKSGHRTAPSAMSLYPLDLYVFVPDGVYLYRPAEHCLWPVVEGDHRDIAGTQPYVPEAPLSVVIFADYERISTGDAPIDAALRRQEMQSTHLDAGTVTENGALYAASHGLNYVTRLMADPVKIAAVIPQTAALHYIVAVSAGYPDPDYRKE